MVIRAERERKNYFMALRRMAGGPGMLHSI
jgi:hypothetical protein